MPSVVYIYVYLAQLHLSQVYLQYMWPFFPHHAQSTTILINIELVLVMFCARGFSTWCLLLCKVVRYPSLCTTSSAVPTVKPQNVTVDRVNPTSLRVSWIPLTLHEARGRPVYTVFVESASQRTARAIQSVPTMNSSVVVDNLDPASFYSVSVQVGTGAGTNLSLRTDPGVTTSTVLLYPCVGAFGLYTVIL